MSSISYTDITGAAGMLRLSYGQMLRLVTRGDVEAVRINGHWRVVRESVEAYAERQHSEHAGGRWRVGRAETVPPSRYRASPDTPEPSA